MANKTDALLELARNSNQLPATFSEPGFRNQYPIQNLMGIIAQVASKGNPNTELGQIGRSGGQAFIQGANQNAKVQYRQSVQQIIQSPEPPNQKIDKLLTLTAQHGTDYGFGVNDAIKMYQDRAKLQAGSAPVPVISKTDAIKKGTVPKNAKIVAEAGMVGTAGLQDINDTAKGIIEGNLSPILSDVSRRDKTAINARLQRAGFNVNKAAAEYRAVQKYITSVNSPQQVRLRQAIVSSTDGIDELERINEEFKRFNFTPLNKAQLLAALTGADPRKRDLATSYITQINVIKDELAQTFMGGNSPTDRAIGLAEEMLKSEYGVKQLNTSLSQLKKNLKYRLNAIDSVGPVVPGGFVQNQNFMPQGYPTAQSVPGLNQGQYNQSIQAGGQKRIVRTGKLGNKKVVQYSDGTTDYAT